MTVDESRSHDLPERGVAPDGDSSVVSLATSVTRRRGYCYYLRMHGCLDPMARPTKGDRDFLGVRAPRQVGDAVRQSAAKLGMTVNDYAAAILAEHEGLGHLATATPLPPFDEGKRHAS